MEVKLTLLAFAICVIILKCESAPVDDEQKLMAEFQQFLSQDFGQDRNFQSRSGEDLRRKQWFWITYWRENLKPLIRILFELWKVRLKESTAALQEMLQEELINSGFNTGTRR